MGPGPGGAAGRVKAWIYVGDGAGNRLLGPGKIKKGFHAGMYMGEVCFGDGELHLKAAGLPERTVPLCCPCGGVSENKKSGKVDILGGRKKL